MEYDHVVDTTRLSFSSLYSLGSSVYSHVKGAANTTRPPSLADSVEHEGSFRIGLHRAEWVANTLANRKVGWRAAAVPYVGTYEFGVPSQWLELVAAYFAGEGECFGGRHVVAWVHADGQWRRRLTHFRLPSLGGSQERSGTTSSEITKSHTDTAADKWHSVLYKRQPGQREIIRPRSSREIQSTRRHHWRVRIGQQSSQ
jgi:hypothetical protein